MMESPSTVKSPITILRYYLLQIRKRIWLVALLGLIAVIVSAWNAGSTRPLYQAAARIVIEEPIESRVLPFHDPLSKTNTYTYRQTQMEILRSRSLALQVIEELGLEHHPAFKPGPAPPKDLLGKLKFSVRQRILPLLERFATYLEVGLETTELANAEAESSITATLNFVRQFLLGWVTHSMAWFAFSPEELLNAASPPSKDELVPQILRHLKITEIPSTEVIRVAFSAYDAALAAQVPNTLVNIYAKQAQQSRFKAAQDAIDWLNERVDHMRERVETSALKLERYKKEHGITSINERLPGIDQKLYTLDNKLTEVRAERIELGTLYNEMLNASDQLDVMEWMPLVAESHTIPQLKQNYIDLQHDLSKLKQRYGYGHPKVLRAQEELATQRRNLDTEIRNIVQGTKTRYEMVKAREQALVDRAQDLQREIEELNRKAIAFGSLKRDAESDRRLSELLLTRLKETSLSPEVTTQDNIRVLDEAGVPKQPINLRFSSSLTKAGVVGIILGMLLAAGLGYFDQTLKNPDEVETLLGFPIIGLIGRYTPRRRHKGRSGRESLALQDAPHSSITEAFKALRTNLLINHHLDMPSQVFLITSARPNEGKTTIAANLASAVSQTENRVLLIEADLRNPSLHRYFDIDDPIGLSELLEVDDFSAPITPLTHNLTVISAGRRPENPSELLDSTNMRRVLAWAREHYDIVIIDSPPLMVVSDAVILSPLVDGILMVLRANVTTMDQARRAISQLTTTGAVSSQHPDKDEDSPIRLGLVMNDLRASDSRSYGYYDASSYYSYYRTPDRKND